MANRYWVGGTGTWSSTNTTNWSATSGGSGGASVPTSSDKVYFDANSGAGFPTVTIANGYTAVCYAFSKSGSGITITSNSYQGSLTIGDTSGGLNCGDYIDTSGYIYGLLYLTINASTSGTPSVFNTTTAIGSNTALWSYLAQGTLKASTNCYHSGNFTVQSGATLDVSGTTFNCGTLTASAGGTINVSASTLQIAGNWYVQNGATVNNSLMTLLKLTSTSSSFSDDRLSPQTYPSIDINSGSGNYASFYASATVTASALTLRGNGLRVNGGVTISLGTIDTSLCTVGTAILTTIGGTSTFTLTSASGTRQLNKLIISNCTATGGASFTADTTSIDAGNNSGILFANSSGFLAFFY